MTWLLPMTSMCGCLPSTSLTCTLPSGRGAARQCPGSAGPPSQCPGSAAQKKMEEPGADFPP
eukprot:CAMPEP_0194588276 /NCGR_PEP_ID=MMETSP0292-20121207/19668_1 /TAXON_ID=39354 /ORGANISM="Heterosigma akashiwo, Strain CCMP2393" /LENGTH=61 /DNA_ID=CAMNT_0039444717 /DNA_START=754 /DNA_END=939 /DNA_ORIENTATION=-